MKNNHEKPSGAVDAIRTSEGFIEITSLELLDEMVGGLVDPETMFCQLNDNENTKVGFANAGV